MSDYTVNLIVGPILCGKSTYIENNFPVQPGLVRVFIGRWLRDAIGLQAMAVDPNPNQCSCTEMWVRLHSEGSFKTRYFLEKEHHKRVDMVFDGYPRSPEQVRWLYRAISKEVRLSGSVPDVVVHSLVVSENFRQERLHDRSKGDLESVKFDKLRFHGSSEDVDRVLDEIQTVFSGFWPDTRKLINLNIMVMKNE